MPKKQPKPTDNQKLILPDNIVEMIGHIVDQVNQVREVVESVHTGNFQKAVLDLLSLIGSIINNLILPKVLPKSKASAPEDQGEDVPQDQADGTAQPEPTPAE